jgi:hypothetical protein
LSVTHTTAATGTDSGDGKISKNAWNEDHTVDTGLTLPDQGSTPSTPASGHTTVFTKSDGLYVVDDSGTETGPFVDSVAFASYIVSTLNADANNYNPANLHTASSVIFTSFTASRTLTGLDAGVTGEIKILVNNTGYSLVLASESASSTDINRFGCADGASVTVRKYGSVMLVYLYSRWKVIAI